MTTDVPDDRPRPRSRVVYGSVDLELRRSSTQWTATANAGGLWTAIGYSTDSPLAAIRLSLQAIGDAMIEPAGARAVRALRAAVGEEISIDEAARRWRAMSEDEKTKTLDVYRGLTKTRP